MKRITAKLMPFVMLLFTGIIPVSATSYFTPQGVFVGNYEPERANVAIITHDYVLGRDSITEFGMSAKHFNTIARIVRLESLLGDADEVLYIAHTANNRARELGISLYDLLMTSYSSVKSWHKTEMDPLDTSLSSCNARAALIDVLLGNPDPTQGATFWDGTDFLAWGLQSPNGTPQNKFEEYNCIEIPLTVFTAYLYNHQLRYRDQLVRYSRREYEFPAPVFTEGSNWNGSNFAFYTASTSPFQIEATATAGYSIFWKKYPCTAAAD
ncbi:MAG: hypothetical protein IBJ09_00185 [Bacteroidia bacterium]|nr:hypothetical protein [Bacteroidia bacterium]